VKKRGRSERVERVIREVLEDRDKVANNGADCVRNKENHTPSEEESFISESNESESKEVRDREKRVKEIDIREYVCGSIWKVWKCWNKKTKKSCNET